jgi:hypothetical protein
VQPDVVPERPGRLEPLSALVALKLSLLVDAHVAAEDADLALDHAADGTGVSGRGQAIDIVPKIE